ncbi:hypothetical protein ACFQ8T_18370 [Isoptericola sp. NPDC056618]|uniref:hypothetical protein n=1 Tax=Isoptericola sp. NPDC056618 TaxID=3345878 RepID=UPI0036C89DF6
MTPVTELDVLQIGEFRFAGGSGRRLAEEVEALSDLGLQVGLMALNTSRFKRGTPWHRRILEVLKRPNVFVVEPTATVATDLTVLRHPALLAEALPETRRIRTGRALVVANQSRVIDGIDYDATQVHEALTAWLGILPTWMPIDGHVRDELLLSAIDRQAISDTDWIQLPWREEPESVLAYEAEGLSIFCPEALADQVRTSMDAYGPLQADGGDVRLFVGDGSADPSSTWRVALGAAHAGFRVILPARAVEEIGWSGPTYSHRGIADAVASVAAGVVRSPVVGRALHDVYARDLVHHLYGYGSRRDAGRPSPRAATRGQRARPVVLFVTSNGAGMGHLTRELGIARALAPYADPVFVSLSQGVPVVRKFGFPYEYVPFTSALHAPADQWNRYFRERLKRAIETYDAACVVFDGVWPYGGLIQAVKATGVRSVWVRRGMWKPHISPDQLRTASRFDLVIEPGDFAASMDRGATTTVSDALKVEPITVISSGEILGRDEARQALHLPLGNKLALVTLGAGNINNIVDMQGLFVRAVQGLGPEWRAVVTTPPIADSSGVDEAIEVSAFPLARYAMAFDFAVSATGYNSYHEWLIAGLPAIWVPNHDTITDDQDARAEFAEREGLGLNVPEPTAASVGEAVRTMGSTEVRQKIGQRAEDLPRTNGATRAAAAIAELLGVHAG